jgi:hypothetical protein
MRVKHFRLETDDKRYLLALLPINFGKLADDRAVDAAITTEGHYLLAIDDDAYVEADPYGWIGKDWDLVYAHFFLREKAGGLRGGTVLRATEIRAEVAATVERLVSERSTNSQAAEMESSNEATSSPASK